MAGRLKGKVAGVTAAGQGIGRAIAEAFVAEGATVWATDLDVAKLDGLARAKRRKLDVLSDRQVAAFAEKVGPVDILVNAAGFVHHGTILECDEKAWDFTFDLNVRSMHRMIRAFLPGMLAKGGGSIVNIASVAATIAFPGIMGYSGTKSAVDRMTRVAAVEAGKLGTGVRINCIYPGLVPTVMGVQLAQNVVEVGLFPRVDAAIGAVVEQTPLGRLGDPTDMADAVVFLASDASRFITGIGLPVDGGMGT